MFNNNLISIADIEFQVIAPCEEFLYEPSVLRSKNSLEKKFKSACFILLNAFKVLTHT